MTSGILRSVGPFPPADPIGRLYLSELTVPLGRRSDPPTSFSLSIRFRVDPPVESAEQWEIQTFAYAFSLYRGVREILAYHWEPEASGANAVLTPHAHFGKDLPNPTMSPDGRRLINSLASAHMPTGAVPFTALLRTVIRDFGVEPMRLQGERPEVAKGRTDSALTEAEAALLASFDWWNRQARVA